MIHRIPLVPLCCLAALVIACYGGVLFGGRQIAFRDSGYFYYPLYWRVQQEWSAGRLPLWEPGANGGQPMLGSPMAAVLYPGKLVFALVPYAWGVRLYTVGHEVLAFWAMMALLRSWGVGLTGSTLAGLSYAFGGPVLSGYFNIIYLVGAAWIPLGFRASDRWLRLGRRWGLPELALVLTMQVLGGDPEAAYLTMVCAFGYAVGLARSQAGVAARPGAWMLGLALVGAAWVGTGPGFTRLVHSRGGQWQPIVTAAWAIGIVAYVVTRPPGHRARLAGMLGGLMGAGILALLLVAVQVLPVLEHIGASVRWSAGAPEGLFDSSLVPYRALEWIWPNVFGTFTAGNRYWIPILPPEGAQRPSPLSLYGGALPLILALGALTSRGGPPWRGWVIVVALLSLWGSLGQFAGPSGWSAGVARGVDVGPARPAPVAGDDSFYGLLTTALPALRLFRFPFKLLPLTSLGLSVLAGLGWDRFAAGSGRRQTLTIGGVMLVLTLLCLSATVALRGRLTAAIASRGLDHAVFGPLDSSGAVADVVRGLAHGAIALTASLCLLTWSTGRRRAASAAMAMALLTVDLAVADAALIITVPQADFEREPEVLRAIREAERADPGPGPFRVQRLPSWVPIGWSRSTSPGRLRELVDWEIDTLQPGFGWLHGIDYVFVDESETAPADLRGLVRPDYRALDPGVATALGIPPGRPVLYHPRGVYDLWGARYFIIPTFPGDWDRANRSYAAFVDQTDLIYPNTAPLEGTGHLRDRQQWLLSKDVQVRRNRLAFPRAWVVRDVRIIRPVEDARPAPREGLIARLRSADTSSPVETSTTGADLRRTAYVEVDHPADLAGYLQGSYPEPHRPSESAADKVTVRESTPTRVVMDALLQRPGLVVLADRFDPGWRLAIDGRPAPLLRANLLMRAAAVAAGSHTLVYTFEPASVRIGGCVSLAGLAVLAGLFAWARVSSRTPRTRFADA